MREYADIRENYDKTGETFALYTAIGDSEGGRKLLKESVYKKYLDLPLASDAVDKLYPDELNGSVSSLETYAGCAYRYFLSYGLRINPVDTAEIQTSDKGALAHEILKMFSERLKADGLDWTSFTDEYAGRVIPEIADDAATAYAGASYRENDRDEYNIERLARLVENSALFIRDQLAAGSFKPVASEDPFEMDILLPNGKNLHMRGTIDRIDTAPGEDGTYVQIVDYKSGSKDINLSMLLDGRQIQLPRYMYSERKK